MFPATCFGQFYGHHHLVVHVGEKELQADAPPLQAVYTIIIITNYYSK